MLSKSKQSNLLKYLLLIPIITGMLFYTSCESEITSTDLKGEHLDQYSYTLKKDEIISKEKTDILNKHEAFLKNSNGAYVSWISLNEETGVITYTIHKSSEEVAANFRELELNFNDESSYVSYTDSFSFNESREEIIKQNIKSVNVKNRFSCDEIDKNNFDYISFEVIDQVPIFPGCDGSENEKDCMSKEINNFVAQNFNTNLGKTLGLYGKQKISVFFTINKEGNITNIKTRAKHPELENEAKRVVNMLPKLKAGEQDGKPANVNFFLPIKFKISE